MSTIAKPDRPRPVDRARVGQMLGDLWTGGLRWWNAWAAFVSLVFLAGAIYSASRMLTTADDAARVHWAVGVIVCAQVVTMLKIWFWMQMDRAALVREMRRQHRHEP